MGAKIGGITRLSGVGKTVTSPVTEEAAQATSTPNMVQIRQPPKPLNYDPILNKPNAQP